jgi:hypothetical protein
MRNVLGLLVLMLLIGIPAKPSQAQAINPLSAPTGIHSKFDNNKFELTR